MLFALGMNLIIFSSYLNNPATIEKKKEKKKISQYRELIHETEKLRARQRMFRWLNKF